MCSKLFDISIGLQDWNEPLRTGIAFMSGSLSSCAVAPELNHVAARHSRPVQDLRDSMLARADVDSVVKTSGDKICERECQENIQMLSNS